MTSTAVASEERSDWLNVKVLGVSGSKFETTASTMAGSKQITVADAGDFRPGQGVVISKCRHYQDKRHIWGPRQKITWAKELGDKAELRGYDGSQGDWLILILDVPPGVPSTFRWSEDFGHTWHETVPMTDQWQPLRDGMEVRFGEHDWENGYTVVFSLRGQLATDIEKIEGNVITLRDAPARTAKDAALGHRDDDALQAAIDRAIKEKKNVYIPVGHYRLFHGLFVRDAEGITIEGASGVETVLDIGEGEGACLTLSKGTGVNVRNLRFIGHSGFDRRQQCGSIPMVSYRLPVPHPRVQYLCTQEHTAMGLGSILLGANIARYRIWDGMRAIDYLQSRNDIIAEEIGCTGNSGGGTLTAYLVALDDRIVAAAPVCYLTTFRKLIDTRGAQDAEQNIFGQVAFGMDEPDYVMMRAPKPTLICAGRRDVTFDIDGTWNLFRQLKEFYARLGYAERVDLNDADLPHGFYLQQREAAARWMFRWLLGEAKVIHEVEPASLPVPASDKELRALSEGDWTQEDLYCSPEGQVLLMEGEESVFQLNAELEQELRRQRTSNWKKLTDVQRRELVRATIDRLGGARFQCAEHDAVMPHDSAGTIQREGYTIEKLILTPEPGVRLPALAFIPAERKGQATLYLHGESMKTDAAPGGPIESLVKQGQIVLAAELRGIGETETGHDKRDYGYGKFGRDDREIFLAYLIGRSYVGMRTEDVASWSRMLAEYKTTDDRSSKLHLIAIGEAAIPALHAAALHPERFVSVRLRNMISSWVEVVRTPDNLNQAASVVHGALKHYDLPDLIELAGANKVRVEEPLDVMGNPVASK